MAEQSSEGYGEMSNEADMVLAEMVREREREIKNIEAEIELLKEARSRLAARDTERRQAESVSNNQALASVLTEQAKRIR